MRFLKIQKHQKQKLGEVRQRVEDEKREAEVEREARRSDFEDELTSTYHLQ
jgi:Spy/CpxP family protein refolding chaperone